MRIFSVLPLVAIGLISCSEVFIGSPGTKNVPDAPTATDGVEFGLEDRVGWSSLMPSTDSRMVHVCSSGDDGNAGTLNAPLKTLSAAYLKLRNNSADWLLLCAGGVWQDQTIGRYDVYPNGSIVDAWDISGRSPSEPIVVTSYGVGPRPQILIGANRVGVRFQADMISNVIMQDLDFYAPQRDPENLAYTFENGSRKGALGIRIYGRFSNLTIEGCSFSHLSGAIAAENANPAEPSELLRLRRNIFLKTYMSKLDPCDLADQGQCGSHSSGLFVGSGIRNVLLEENIFDHNGWHSTINGAQATIFNHNVYIASGVENVVSRYNFFARGAATNLQQRPGGVAEYNISIDGSLGITFGHRDTLPDKYNRPPCSGIMKGNLVLGSKDVTGTALSSNGVTRSVREPRGFGLVAGTCDGLVIEDNIVSQLGSDSTGSIYGIYLDMRLMRTEIKNNTVKNWSKPGGVGTEFAAGLSRDAYVSESRFEFAPNNFAYWNEKNVVFTDNRFSTDLDSKPFVTAHSNFSWASIMSGTIFTTREPSSWFATGIFATQSHLSREEFRLSFPMVSMQSPTYSDSSRSLERYTAEVLKISGGLDGFINQAKQQRKGHWRLEYSARSINNWIRAGFRHSMVPRPYESSQ
jgi:hypothetical protein